LKRGKFRRDEQHLEFYEASFRHNLALPGQRFKQYEDQRGENSEAEPILREDRSDISEGAQLRDRSDVTTIPGDTKVAIDFFARIPQTRKKGDLEIVDMRRVLAFRVVFIWLRLSRDKCSISRDQIVAKGTWQTRLRLGEQWNKSIRSKLPRRKILLESVQVFVIA
jgi:hypothetical protein